MINTLADVIRTLCVIYNKGQFGQVSVLLPSIRQLKYFTGLWLKLFPIFW